MKDLPPLSFAFTGIMTRAVAEQRAKVSPARPRVDVKASALAQFGDNHRVMIGKRVLVNDKAMIVDSASDLGDGYWRLRLMENRWPD